MPKLKLAVILAMATAVISGTNNFLTKIAVTAVQDPVAFTFLKNAVVGVFLVGIIIAAKKWGEIRRLNRMQAIQLSLIALIGGAIPFILFFTGLTMIPAVNAAFIHKTLFIWVAILAIPYLKERLGSIQIAALLLLLAGNLVMGVPKLKFGTGEMLILAATLLWAVENIIAKKALANLSSLTVAGARMALGSVFIFLVVLAQGNAGQLLALNATQWGWTLLTSVLLLGYVTTWYTALKIAPATLVAALLVPATLITNVLNGIFITHSITLLQIYNGLLLILGTTLIIRGNARFRVHPRVNPPISAPTYD
ncbi:hypothetical protein A3J36_03615 [Candidatus Uhrbacteria bacterium RIFCSPLOWO2_02_FULL_54_37]|uniref:EamA domain-containing protein n=2 Tax=Candidatus Uhriibacteriota TaxID=1752732 RepID=A0A1F7VJ95_9BACT|nr:MAG: hypothetical protein A3B36_01095 [Candidatus Uhrbacteria bacterium RIFCSPLOWO2_01_FULL_55_36]OGL90575.1 MAG: hypothetical protein A3J36_03615 [Candidatus Uhrbacteria bacterium RIFCSPLOWO2_02_FULL_54_37]